VRILDNHLATTQPTMEASGVAIEDAHGNRWNLQEDSRDGLQLRLIETGRGFLTSISVQPLSANTVRVTPA
jgi:hypothetical protein